MALPTRSKPTIVLALAASIGLLSCYVWIVQPSLWMWLPIFLVSDLMADAITAVLHFCFDYASSFEWPIEVDVDTMSNCSCTVCTKKGILHLGTGPATFQQLRGKTPLKSYTFGTGVAQHTFCAHCGMHPFYIPRWPASRHRQCPVPGRYRRASLKPTWEDAQRRRIAETGRAPPLDVDRAKTLQAVADQAPVQGLAELLPRRQ